MTAFEKLLAVFLFIKTPTPVLEGLYVTFHPL